MKAVARVLVITAMALLGGGAASAAAATLVVDQDRVQCPEATFTSINAAIAAAAPGDTVQVCPDRYMESVLVPKTLTLVARRTAGAADRARGCFDSTPPADDPTREAIVTGALIGINVQADGVVVDGFVLTGSGAFGVSTGLAFSGQRLRNLLVHDNGTFGVRVRSNATAPSVLETSCVRHEFIGVWAPATRNVRVERNALHGNQEAGVIIASSTSVAISQNLSTEDNVFTLVFGPSSALDISRNVALRSSDPTVASIALGDTSDSSVSQNVIADGAANGIGFAGPDVGGGVSTNLTVRQNVVTHMGLSGIRVTPGSLQASLIDRNVSSLNGRDGIRIETDPNAGNRILSNVLQRNAEHDCHDDTHGTGTAGTANTWAGTRGTSNRPGLCAGKEDR